MGLGLTISKMIIQQLGGNISVESKYSIGSKFVFQIKVEDVIFGNEETKNDLMKMNINDTNVNNKHNYLRRTDLPTIHNTKIIRVFSGPPNMYSESKINKSKKNSNAVLEQETHRNNQMSQ